MIASTPRWVWAWIVLWLLIGSVPMVAAMLATPDGSTFTGTIYNPLDLNSYLANMQQGRDGHWLYVLPYTAERSTPMPLFMVYILLGHVARLTALSLPAVFHTARIVCAAVFAFTAYRFMAHFLRSEAERKLAFGLLLFTGGMSWLVIAVLGSDLSDDLLEIPDYWVSDAVSFLAMLSNPHFMLNMTFIMWFILAGEAFFQRGDWRAALPALLTGFGIAFVHAHQLAVVGLIVGLDWLLRCTRERRIRWAEAGRIAVVFAPVALLASTLTLLTWQDDLLSSWLAQSRTLAPPIWSIGFILYGPLFWFAITGAVHIARQRDADRYPVALWFAVVLVLIYLPVNFQRRFLEGWHVPVTMLGAVGWRRVLVPWLADHFSLRAARTAGALWFAALTLTPLVILARGLLPALNGSETTYLDRDTYRALQWIRAHDAGDDTIVFAGFDNGNLIPAWTTARTTLGHYDLTVPVADRWDEAERFFDADTPHPERIRILRALNVDYVYIGEDERDLGSFDPATASYLERAFSSGSVSIYRFDAPPPSGAS